jgi:hypothetical protein
METGPPPARHSQTWDATSDRGGDDNQSTQAEHRRQ